MHPGGKGSIFISARPTGRYRFDKPSRANLRGGFLRSATGGWVGARAGHPRGQPVQYRFRDLVDVDAASSCSRSSTRFAASPTRCSALRWSIAIRRRPTAPIRRATTRHVMGDGTGAFRRAVRQHDACFPAPPLRYPARCRLSSTPPPGRRCRSRCRKPAAWGWGARAGPGMVDAALAGPGHRTLPRRRRRADRRRGRGYRDHPFRLLRRRGGRQDPYAPPAGSRVLVFEDDHSSRCWNGCDVPAQGFTVQTVKPPRPMATGRRRSRKRSPAPRPRQLPSPPSPTCTGPMARCWTWTASPARR